MNNMAKELNNWQRALLAFLLLNEMSVQPAHGYALSARLAERGFERVKGAALYPALSKLESDGYCQAHWEEGTGGPGRKVYHLTQTGQSYLLELRQVWSQWSKRVDQLCQTTNLSPTKD